MEGLRVGLLLPEVVGQVGTGRVGLHTEHHAVTEAWHSSSNGRGFEEKGKRRRAWKV